MNLPELDVSGLAMVTSIDDCPPIADGEGSVVTARFVTREVHIVASVDVLGSDGIVETITGTTIHPIWSVDRQEWVPLGELVEGETLQGQDGLAVILSVTLSRVTQPVYNIEVHGEHVYQVGELGVLVHNVYPLDLSGAKALSHLRYHAQHARETAVRQGLARPNSLGDVQEFLSSVIRNGETRIGTWAQEGDVMISKLGDAIVIRRLNGQYLTNLDFAKGGNIVKRWSESTPIHWIMP
ncbi:MAG: polymorphic toxin-type HINT domain-containing protein [Pirellula sp.]